MSLIVVLSIIFIHWVADFIFQAEEWANNKSNSNSYLFTHVLTYTIIWGFLGSFLFTNPCGSSLIGCVEIDKLGVFLGVTFVAHFITDYITSRIVKKRFEDKYYGSPIPNFGAFTIIGFDQVLHYAQLFLTYYLLTK
jgi:hypothetical protein